MSTQFQRPKSSSGGFWPYEVGPEVGEGLGWVISGACQLSAAELRNHKTKSALSLDSYPRRLLCFPPSQGL